MNKMILLAALLSGCCGSHRYPQATIDKFVSDCVKSGGSIEQCECCIGRIQKAYPYDEYATIERSGVDLPEPMVRVCMDCRRGR